MDNEEIVTQEENITCDTEKNEEITPHLAVDDSNHTSTPIINSTNETVNWSLDHTIWKDIHGIWHDIHGRWRGLDGVWHEAPYDIGEHPVVHWFDHAINFIINHKENATNTGTPLTPTEKNAFLNFGININLK